MPKVLFICAGNVGRSQMAEAYFNHFHGSGMAISAGIEDVGKKYRWKPRQDITDVMKEEGINISEQRIKQINPGMLNDIEIIVILCSKDICPNFLLSSNKRVEFIEIPDPYESSFAELRRIRNRIKEVIKNL